MISYSTSAVEGAYEAAKWLKIPLLIDADELSSLFSEIGCKEIYPMGSLIKDQSPSRQAAELVQAMTTWVSMLQNGKPVLLSDTKPLLTCAISRTPDCFWLQEVKGGSLLKIRRPVVQISAHFFSFAKEEKSFHSMVFGKESIFWGIQCSYPQIFMDPKEQQAYKIDVSFENTELFHAIRRWTRDHTRPTPFVVGGQTVNVPVRLGKRCFPWIHQHPQLKQHGLGVAHVS